MQHLSLNHRESPGQVLIECIFSMSLGYVFLFYHLSFTLRTYQQVECLRQVFQKTQTHLFRASSASESCAWTQGSHGTPDFLVEFQDVSSCLRGTSQCGNHTEVVELPKLNTAKWSQQ